MKQTCQCRKKNGELCRRSAKEGSKYCWQHGNMKVIQSGRGPVGDPTPTYVPRAEPRVVRATRSIPSPQIMTPSPQMSRQPVTYSQPNYGYPQMSQQPMQSQPGYGYPNQPQVMSYQQPMNQFTPYPGGYPSMCPPCPPCERPSAMHAFGKGFQNLVAQAPQLLQAGTQFAQAGTQLTRAVKTKK